MYEYKDFSAENKKTFEELKGSLSRGGQSMKGREKNLLFNKVISFIFHDDWYTKEQIATIRSMALNFSFSANQKERIAEPPIRQPSSEEHYAPYDGPDDLDQ